MRSFLLLLLCAAAALSTSAQETPLPLHWQFNRGEAGAPVDSVRGMKARLDGAWAYVPGVAGDALRFDGATTSMTVPLAEDAGLGRSGLTVEAWVALNTYPWNWVPVVDNQLDRQEGFFFGIDAFGRFSLQASIDGQWQSVTSVQPLPLKRWVHIAGVYATHNGAGTLTLYLNGEPAGQLPVQAELSPARTNLLIGRVREAALPFPEAVVKPQLPIWYSLDGILDELTIDAAAHTPQQIAGDFGAATAPTGDVLPWPKMPSGPPGPGRFGAYATTLHYQDTWDRLRRIGPDADVIVRFDESPIRVVFWQGTNYIPAWVTGDDKWYTDEFLETWGDDACAPGWDCEPMSDKQSRYSHVNILESNNARAVVHWRYALAEVERLAGAWTDPRTGWFEWADEYWTIYPDGVAIRKQVLHSGNPTRSHEWQETIILHQPGMKPEDDIHSDAITLENMQGETKTYTWKPRPAGVFGPPDAPRGVTGPPDPNIQIVNLRSDWKPFQIVPADGASADIYNNEDTYFEFECWNHWPVAEIPSSDRPCVSNDRASHSSLSHLYWKLYAHDESTATKILMDGLTQRTPAELLPLAKSWLSPPNIQVESSSYRSDGYDPTQRAFVAEKIASGATEPLIMTLAASSASPLFDPAIVIRNWGDAGARVKIDGRAVAAGKTLRIGHEAHLDGTDLVIWMERESTQSLRLEIQPSEQ